MLNILFNSFLYIFLFYIFILVRGTVPRYKITTLVSYFWRFIILYLTCFLVLCAITITLFI